MMQTKRPAYPQKCLVHFGRKDLQSATSWYGTWRRQVAGNDVKVSYFNGSHPKI